MPFTLAHPAAVLPLRDIEYLRTVPLILGALVPDAPHYVPTSIGRFMPGTHSLWGSCTTCLALGYIGLVAIFLLRRPLTALLSARARWLYLSALAPFGRRPLEWLFAPLAIVVGVWTHLAWDSFSHPEGGLVLRVAALSTPITLGGYTGPPLYHVLQYLSSVLGLIVMAVWYWRLPVPRAAPPPAGATRSPVGPVLLLIGAAAVLIGSVQALQSFDHSPELYRTLVVFLTRGLAWFALLYLVAGIIVTLERKGGATPR